MSNVIIVGAQWGDEGKGNVARFQGGHNVKVGGRKLTLPLVMLY